MLFYIGAGIDIGKTEPFVLHNVSPALNSFQAVTEWHREMLRRDLGRRFYSRVSDWEFRTRDGELDDLCRSGGIAYWKLRDCSEH